MVSGVSGDTHTVFMIFLVTKANDTKEVSRKYVDNKLFSKIIANKLLT